MFFGAGFAGYARFAEARFTEESTGDLRTCTLGMAHAARAAPARRLAPWAGPWRGLPARLREAGSAGVGRGLTWARHGWLGWDRVRTLGGLALLNRVSLVALLLVPVLAAAFTVIQRRIDDQPAVVSQGERLLAGIVGEHPHLSTSIALAFFASVAVMLGLLVYQVSAPGAIKKHDEDEYVRDVEARYPEEDPKRNDGLRRAIERLEDQVRLRPGRYKSFVHHHGDLIWIPPRNKIEWFDDQTLPTMTELQTVVDETCTKVGRQGAFPKATEPMSREGHVPGLERARICIEEGARAEYWLLAHKRVGWAWLSFLLYVMGAVCLMVLLVIQCMKVANATW